MNTLSKSGQLLLRRNTSQLISRAYSSQLSVRPSSFLRASPNMLSGGIQRNFLRAHPLRFYSSETIAKSASEKKPSKLKELITKYGKTATVAYLGISAIDLALTFWLVSVGGEGFVSSLENWLLENFGNWKFVKKEVEDEILSTEEKQSGAPSLTSTFLVAYSIHKLLMPIRVPITAAVTPSLARKFQQLGWTIFVKKP
ncbi:hypothetical protein K493DRAFT_316797 [Basidiobolus meristosporus CBS 931.73]|uniref:DUF1279 domain-containing protein n=1 Tax=Basidiobolus meristosporus CBS 931.73 TaxID=1314790 RepID=A0A1Y1Y2L9_9FUNG|nr:hypothetical protein K493DRAFT_316797 [Basidiobolus meristosporus CBS 931.73]|eukprot:ORX92125.1 hypothetical protein K493DRAFT_316797 [Basidiobolus meristosporus CBS 931.73]